MKFYVSRVEELVDFDLDCLEEAEYFIEAMREFTSDSIKSVNQGREMVKNDEELKCEDFQIMFGAMETYRDKLEACLTFENYDLLERVWNEFLGFYCDFEQDFLLLARKHQELLDGRNVKENIDFEPYLPKAIEEWILHLNSLATGELGEPDDAVKDKALLNKTCELLKNAEKKFIELHSKGLLSDEQYEELIKNFYLDSLNFNMVVDDMTSPWCIKSILVKQFDYWLDKKLEQIKMVADMEAIFDAGWRIQKKEAQV